jgi:hypothetical protein
MQIINVYKIDNKIKTSILKKNEIIKVDVSKKEKSDTIQNTKKLNDTTIVFFFTDLSNVYNYKIIDKYINVDNKKFYDSVSRVIKVYTKNDSLIQKIYPDLQITPWYYFVDYQVRISRSFVTGKNAHYDDVDNYCGEIVIADLNFDGLEDFATPVNSGADNGPHYAFYIQNELNKFKLNNYLTENVVWFPEKINDSLMTLTNEIPGSVYYLYTHSYKYDTISKKWKKVKSYSIDIRTGKISR